MVGNKSSIETGFVGLRRLFSTCPKSYLGLPTFQTPTMDSLYHQPTMEEANVLRDLATKLRIHSVKMTAASKSGHPTSCSSMAEVMSVLFFKVMKYKDPRVHKEGAIQLFQKKTKGRGPSREVSVLRNSEKRKI